MKKEEMITLLRSVSCDENTVTAMTNAYELGFDYGSKAYVFLTEALEHAKTTCDLLDLDKLDEARESIVPFWKALDKLRDME